MSRFLPATLARDLPASIVVFLVALPLCMGIAGASGVPPEKGLLTGIVGGVVVGLLAGSPLQVSGPAAGLAVIVFEIVREHGVGMLGPIIVLAGFIQLAAGALRLGQWFRAISPAVVHGMLAGIGVLIVAGQIHVLLDATPRANGFANLTAIPGAFLSLTQLDGSVDERAVLVGGVTILTMLAWERWRPHALRFVPAALIGVLAATMFAARLSLDVKRVVVPEAIWSSIMLPQVTDLQALAAPGLLVTAIAVAFIASAETLLSAAVVDRMHDGVRTDYNRELAAQGVGNIMCGIIGALPMTGVIVRSSANVQAGAASRLSTVLHGVWILALLAVLPWLLREIPTASLGAVLVVTGWRLVDLRHLRHLFARYGALPAAIWTATLSTVVVTNLLTGVLVGLSLSILEVLPYIHRARLRIRHRETSPGEVEIRLAGAATFLQMPHLLRALGTVPQTTAVLRLNLSRLRRLDHTCLETIAEWVRRAAASGTHVQIDRRSAERYGMAIEAHGAS
jgi:MFS superfamily sulfate permease-like transporter